MIGGDEMDPSVLAILWAGRWPDCRPIDHELRHCAADRWVRFHSLPESKRYAEDDDEYAEVLRRHNTVLDELLTTSTGVQSALVITCSWSDGPEQVPREETLEGLPPRATYWQSILRETDGDWSSGTTCSSEGRVGIRVCSTNCCSWSPTTAPPM